VVYCGAHQIIVYFTSLSQYTCPGQCSLCLGIAHANRVVLRYNVEKLRSPQTASFATLQEYDVHRPKY